MNDFRKINTGIYIRVFRSTEINKERDDGSKWLEIF